MDAVAVLDIALPFTALTVGEQHVSSSVAGILIATTPLFVGALAVALLPTERPSSKGSGWRQLLSASAQRSP